MFRNLFCDNVARRERNSVIANLSNRKLHKIYVNFYPSSRGKLPVHARIGRQQGKSHCPIDRREVVPHYSTILTPVYNGFLHEFKAKLGMSGN
jgi:hypothetical protein